MALTGSDQGSPATATGGLERLKAWLQDAGERYLVQRLAGTVFLIRVASAALAFLSQILLARWMGSFEFGVYVYVWTWVLLIGSLADLGLASSAQRFIPEYQEHGKLALLRGFLTGSRWLCIGVATAIAGVGAVGVLLLDRWIDGHAVIPLYLACVSLPLYALTHMQDGIARSYNWVNLALWPPYILRQLLLLGLMAGAWAAGLPMDATSAMIAAILSVWITTAGQMLVLNRRLAATVEPGPKRYESRRWFATSLPIFMVESFYLLLTYVAILVLQQFRPSDEVAIYYAAEKTLSLVAFIYFAVSATTAHRFTAFHVTKDRSGLEAFLQQSIRWTFWPSLAATAVILALGRPMLWLFGERFTEGYALMFLLAAGLLARAAVGPVERLLNMLGEQRACAIVYAVAFLVNLVLCFALIPPFGVAGAAMATSTALISEAVMLFVVTKRRLGLHVFVFGSADAAAAKAPGAPTAR